MWISLSNILYKKNRPFLKKIESGQLPLVWKKTVKKIYPKAGAHTEYANYHNNVLYIRVSDPIWIGELDSYREVFKKELNQQRKKPIYGIKFILS